MSKNLSGHLQEALQVLNVSLTQQQQTELLSFVELLVKWNKVYNLTSVRDPLRMIDRHILDSLSILPFVHGSRIIDVGAGAGIPGIPLAIALPDRSYALVDSNRKKTRFMQQVKTEMALSQIDVIHSRIENYQPDELFDSVISRAFASLNQMALWSSHLLANGGKLLAMKGSYPEQEIAELANSFEIKAVQKIDYSGLDADRYLLEIGLAKSQNRN
jgi:16S rRNA (guanine527-N7)-methyltransferase